MVIKCTVFEDMSRLKINCIVTTAASVIFFSAWWILIDIHATNVELIKQHGEYYAPGILGTLSLIIINIIPMSYINDNGMLTRRRKTTVLFVVFIALMLGFGSFIAAAYIFVKEYLLKQQDFYWPGIGIFCQNLMILISNGMLKFGTKDPVY